MDAQAASLDTSREAERAQLKKWRAMSPGQRLSLAVSMSQSVRAMALAGVRQRYPDASAREQLLRLAVTIHGRDLATAAYPELAALDLR